MKVYQYDFRWETPENAQIQAHTAGRFARKNVSVGDQLSIEVCSGPACTGNFVGGEWSPCSENATGKSKCEVCRAKEQKESFVFTIFDGFNEEYLNETDKEKISGEHVVYCAFFDAGLLKVGVSKKERKVLRQLEQGAYATLFIAETPDGIKARQIETMIRKNGLQDKVLASQKKKQMDPEISTDDAKKFLLETWGIHKTVIEQSGMLRPFLLETPEFHAWEDAYHLPAVRKIQKPHHDVSLSPGEWVSGTVRSIKGSFVLLETHEECLLFNMKDLNGYEIEYEEKEMGLSLHMALQESLF